MIGKRKSGNSCTNTKEVEKVKSPFIVFIILFNYSICSAFISNNRIVKEKYEVGKMNTSIKFIA